MQQHFELYILSENLTADNWKNFYQALLLNLSLFSKFEITFRCTDNVVRFFISSNQDLSALSNNIEGLLVRPVDKAELELPKAHAKERFQFAGGSNLLDLKEKFKVKKSKDLEYAVFKVRTINIDKAIVNASFYFKNKTGTWSMASKKMFVFPAHLFAIDFATNTHYLKRSVPKYLNIEKSLHMLASDNQEALFEVDTFPYFPQNYYLRLANYEFDKHSFIVGASGSGKSKLISLFVDRLNSAPVKSNYRVIVIDPHNALADDLAYIPDNKVINFSSESTELFGGSATDISAATELTATLFKSLLADQFNPKLDRLLRFSLFVLLTAQTMTLDNLKRFLTDIDYRNKVVEHVSGYVPANIVRFFGADFNELRTKYYNESISPVISLVDEMQLQPTLAGEGELSLQKTISENFLTVFSLNKVSMGEKVVKTVAGLLIQQIFLLAQARAFDQKVILVIDEVSVVQNPSLASILAEARKFNLSVILTQQYFGQVEKDLRDAIFANVYNYYCFKVSEEDACALEGNLNIELPKELAEKEHESGHKEEDVRVKIMTELHPRECLVRVLANGQVVPAVKARTMDAPTSVGAKTAAPKLQSYKQAPSQLPAKFDESRAKSEPASLEASEKQIEPISKDTSGKPTEPQTLGHQALEAALTGRSPAEKAIFNLSELLAEHSSSRKLVNKRKNK